MQKLYSYESAQWGHARWPMTSLLPLLTSMVYDLILWLRLWRYRHCFTWVVLHQIDFSLTGLSWAQALCCCEWGSAPAAWGFLQWEYPGHTSTVPLLLFTVCGALWCTRNDTVDLIPFSLREKKKHVLKGSYFGWVWLWFSGFFFFEAEMSPFWKLLCPLLFEKTDL